jgi:2-polyprenyl-3-methyl-5-hydroxy-6-metoxy-1,4-benzoquinol methylase
MSSRNYDEEYRDTENHKYAYGFDEVLRKFMIREFKPFFNGESALELGCYEGDFSIYIFDNFTDVYVVDGSPELIERTKGRFSNKVTFQVSTFEELQLDQKFDAIFLIHTLEHLDNPIEVLLRCKDWLKPSGKLIVAVPNAFAPSRQIAVKMGIISNCTSVTLDEEKQGHRRTYSSDFLTREIKDAGFKIIKSGGVFFKPLANFQMDSALKFGIINEDFLEGCYELGMQFPELCASTYVIASL